MIFESRQQLESLVVEGDHINFVSKYLFEGVPYLFADNIDNWITWKTLLGGKIEVDPRNIVMTGSAAIGYSLNPGKDFRAFNERSDIDCGVVSPHHFDMAWRYLKRQRTEWLGLPRKVKDAIKMHQQNYVFSGTIATDRILSLLPFGKEWLEALTEMSKVEPTVGRQVNLRVYREFDDLREYQMLGLRNARARILDNNAAEEEQAIGLEE